MPITLNEFKRQACIKFMEKIMSLKIRSETYDFQSALEEIQHSFLVLINSFEIKEAPENKLIVLDKEDKILKVKFYNFIFYVVDGLIIDIEDKHRELAKLFVNKRLDQIDDLISSLWDYEDRCCDICGLYFLKPFFETPIGRKKEDDFYIAYHESCIDCV